MKHRLYLLCFVTTLPFLSLDAQQEVLVKLNIRNVPLVEVLADLEQRYDLQFSYSDEQLSGVRVSARIRQQTLSTAFAQLLNDTPLTFRLIQARYVLILPKEAPPFQPTTAPPVQPSTQSYLLRGKITDATTNSGLPFANIRIVPTGAGGNSEVDGSFALQLSAYPKDSVEISYLGYESQRFSLDEFTRNDQNVALKIQSFGLANVIVRAYLTDGITVGNEVGQITFSPHRIDVIPGQAEPDILQAVLLLPGISSPGESVSDLNIRGGTADQNLVLWDGIPVYHTGHYFGSFTAFNPYIVDEVDVWRGGFGAEYGGRISGVIDIKTKDEIAQKPTLGAGLNLTHGHLQWELPFAQQKLSWLFSARRSFTDFLPTVTFNKFQTKIFQGTKVEGGLQVNGEDVKVLTDRFLFHDLHTKLLWQPGTQDQLSIAFFTGNNTLEYALEEPDILVNDNLQINNWGSLAQWQRQWSDQWQSKLQISHSSFDYRTRFGETFDNTLELFLSKKTNSLTDQRLKSTLQWKPNEQHQFIGGIENTNYQFGFTIDFRSIIEGDDVLEVVNTKAATFVNFLDYTFQDKQQKWRFQFGSRAVSIPNLDLRFWEPRFSFSYRPNKNLRIKGSAGENHQFVNQLIELDFNGLGVNNQIWTLVDDETFPVLQGTQYTAGFDFQSNGWFIDLEAYLKNMIGLTSFSPAFSVLQEDEFSEGQGRVRGLDVLLRKRWKNHHSWISYTWSTSQYLFEDYTSDWLPAFNDQRHQLSLVYLWKKAPFDLSIGWHFHSGKPFTPLNEIELITFEEEEETFTLAVPMLGEINSAYLPAYHRLDASIVYTFSQKKERAPKIQTGLSIINVYNRTNLIDRRFREIIFDEADEPEERIEIFDRNLLPFTPNLFFRIEW